MAPEWTHDESSPLLPDSNGTASTGAIPRCDEEQPADSVQSTEDLAKEPVPDARTQLKYIVPAISIGVRISQFFGRFTKSSAHPRNVLG
jgi:hypothetical protein